MSDLITDGKFDIEELAVLGSYSIEETSPTSYIVNILSGVFRSTKEAQYKDRQILTSRAIVRKNKRRNISVFDYANRVMLEGLLEEELSNQNLKYTHHFTQTAVNFAHEQVRKRYGLERSDLNSETKYGYYGIVLLDNPLILDFGINHKSNMKLGNLHTLVLVDRVVQFGSNW